MGRHGRIAEPFRLGIDELRSISKEVRNSIFETCLNAASGHLGGCSSSVELMVGLYFGGILRFDPNDAYNPERDRVLVRGHLGPLRYKIFSYLNFIHEDELMAYRSLGSRLQGHEDHRMVPGVDITPSGSLGMLLSYGAGAALMAREMKRNFRTFVFLGDGEEQEGNVSEAARHIARLRLDNILAVLDRNGKQLSNPTDETDSADLTKIWQGYGWDVISLDNGHDIKRILESYQDALTRRRPVIVIADTIKGYGLRGAESHFSGYHTIGVSGRDIPSESVRRYQPDEDDKRALNALKGLASPRPAVLPRESFEKFDIDIEPGPDTPVNLDASQLEYFAELRGFLERKDLSYPFFFLTADVTRTDHVEILGLKEFMKFFNVGIREQHMLAMAHGLSATEASSRVLINSFDAFVYRGLDQLNALAQGYGRAVILGDVCGLSNGKNGKTHQTAGHPGAILAMPGVTFLEPGDVRDLFNCLNWAIGQNDRVTYVRIHSADALPFPRQAADLKNISHYTVHDPPVRPEAVLVGSGLTVGSCIDAALLLEKAGLPLRVINVVNQNVLDESFVSGLENSRPVMTVYNGLPRILQASVARAVMESGVKRPSRIIGHGFESGQSGATSDLLEFYKLDARGIVEILRDKLFPDLNINI